jgi:HEAT repeat protein
MKMFLLFSYLFGAQAFAAEFAQQVHEGASSVRASHPELARQVDAMKPVLNRAGRMFFPGQQWAEPTAQLLIQDRLLTAKDDASFRVALAYALNEDHRLPWSEIEVQEEAVRVALIGNYKKDGSAVLRLALTDESSLVRGEAARLCGYQQDSAGLGGALLPLLADDSAGIRRSAVRSLGWLDVKDAYPAIRALLVDADAQVRKASLRALDTIDPVQTRGLPELEQLKKDVDSAVARKATALQR